MTQVFDKTNANVLHLDHGVGQKFVERCDSSKLGSACKGSEHSAECEKRVFQNAYDWMKREILTMEGMSLLQHQSRPMAICFTQPHRDIKEIRFAAWIAAIVLADSYGFDFLFSTDSDTMILPDNLKNLTAILTAVPTAAGTSAQASAHDKSASPIAQMASILLACESYLYRAPLGVFGISEVLPGPSAFFRLKTHCEAVVPWYRYKIFGKRIVSSWIVRKVKRD